MQNTFTYAEAKILNNSLDTMYYALMDDVIKLNKELEQIDRLESPMAHALKREEGEHAEREKARFVPTMEQIRTKIYNNTEVK